jgi:HAD superfamily hydrolase (TIGR01549 family)
MARKAVIFDVDGTLVDSVDLHAEAWQLAFEKFGKIVSFAEVRRQIGKGSDQLLPVFFSERELAEFGRELDSYRSELFKKDFLPRVKGFPRVRELFERILRDKQIALASSAKADELATYKRLAGIDDLINKETSSDDADKSKPFPDIFAAALAQLQNIAARDAIAVGDTPYDAQAAGKIQLSTIGVTCGGWPEQELRRAGCIAVYSGPGDLLNHYDESPLGQSQSMRQQPS